MQTAKHVNEQIRQNRLFIITFQMIVFCLLFQQSFGANSIATTFINDPYIESQTIQLISPNMSQYKANLTFLKPKSMPLSPGNVFIGIKTMAYDINNPYFSTLRLQFNIIGLSVYPSFLVLSFYGLPNYVNDIVLSVLIFDSNFPFVSSIDFRLIQYGTTTSYFNNTALTDTPIIVASFLQYCFIAAMPSFPSFSSMLTVSFTSTSLITRLQLSTGAGTHRIIYNHLIIYSNITSSGTYQLSSQIFNFAQTATNIFSISLPQYSPSYSNILVGLNGFKYLVMNPLNNPGYVWKITNLSFNSFQFQLDDQFQSFNATVFIINALGCTNPSFPIMKLNISSGNTQCYNDCQSYEYVQWESSVSAFVCQNCSQFCLTCLDSTICTSCQAGYNLSQTYACQIPSGYFVDPTNTSNVTQCSTVLAGCVECNSSTICLNCSAQYYLSTTNSCVLCSSVVFNCSKCNQTYCFQCEQNYTLITVGLCQLTSSITVNLPCSDSNCNFCNQSNLAQCFTCKNNYTLQMDGTCLLMAPIRYCGDSIKEISEACDDQNMINYDGCNSMCQIQDGFQCDLIPSAANSSQYMSSCYYKKSIQLNLLQIRKIPQQNKIQIKLKNTASAINRWSQIDISNYIDISIPKFQYLSNTFLLTSTIKFVHVNTVDKNLGFSLFNPQNYQYISVVIQYSLPHGVQDQTSLQSLHYQDCVINFRPFDMNTTLFRNTSVNSKTHFKIAASNGLLIEYNSPQQMQQRNVLKIMAIFVSSFLAIMFFLSIFSLIAQGSISRQLLTTIQTGILVHISYFSLIGIGDLNEFFIGLGEGLKYSLGYEILIMQNQQQSILSSNIFPITALSIESISFANNINISLILPVIPLIIGLFRFLFKRDFETKHSQILSNGQQNFPNNKNRKQNKISDKQSRQSTCFVLRNTFSYKILISFSLGIYLFLFMKYAVFFLLQIKIKSPLLSMDIVMMSLTFTLILIFLIIGIYNFNAYEPLVQKLISKSWQNTENNSQTQSVMVEQQATFPQNNSPNQNSPSTYQIKRNYLIFLILAASINSVMIVFLSNSVIFWSLIPILFYVAQIYLLLKYRFYNRPNIYRVFFNSAAGILLQIVFMIRSILTFQIRQVQGSHQSNFSFYLPFTIVTLLTLTTLLGLLFVLYSIKRFRCCQLSIQWEKSDSSQLKETLKKRHKWKLKRQIQNLNTNNKKSPSINGHLNKDAMNYYSRVQLANTSKNLQQIQVDSNMKQIKQKVRAPSIQTAFKINQSNSLKQLWNKNGKAQSNQRQNCIKQYEKETINFDSNSLSNRLNVDNSVINIKKQHMLSDENSRLPMNNSQLSIRQGRKSNITVQPNNKLVQNQQSKIRLQNSKLAIRNQIKEQLLKNRIYTAINPFKMNQQSLKDNNLYRYTNKKIYDPSEQFDKI